jgi:hypothetical protein
MFSKIKLQLLKPHNGVDSGSLQHPYKPASHTVLPTTVMTQSLVLILKSLLHHRDPNIMQIGNDPIIGLQDIGSGISEDTVSGDSVFSNIIALRSNFPEKCLAASGLLLSLVEEKNQALNAVQSYSM